MKENNNLHIGIDVGSTTVKLAILDEANDVKFAVYRRHHADVRATIVEVLEEAAVDFGPERMTIAITGSGGLPVSYTHLFSVLPTGEVGSHEVYKKAGFGRVYTYNDCVTCHVGSGTDGAATGGAGMFMATTIHGYHYGNQEFLAKGNCFSCHEADAATGELGMWDTLKYSKYIGLGTSAPGTETWIGGRGFKTGTVTGGVVEADVALKNVKTEQNPSSPDDLYGATNMDFPEIDEKDVYKRQALSIVCYTNVVRTT